MITNILLTLFTSLREPELVQNFTFQSTLSNISTIIKKSYKKLRIRARAGLKRTKFTIYSIKLYHYFCEKTEEYNTKLSRVDSSTKNISKEVPCLDNAVSSDGNSTNITVYCTPKGEWKLGNMKCLCDKGFYLDQNCSSKLFRRKIYPDYYIYLLHF